eukprot:gene22574-27248_t
MPRGEEKVRELVKVITLFAFLILSCVLLSTPSLRSIDRPTEEFVRFIRTHADSLPDDGFVEAAGGKRRSPVWEHYKVTIDDESGNILYTKCKLCTDVVLVKYPGNTTNLRGHISGCHKDVYCKMVSTLLHNNSIDQ